MLVSIAWSLQPNIVLLKPLFLEVPQDNLWIHREIKNYGPRTEINIIKMKFLNCIIFNLLSTFIEGNTPQTFLPARIDGFGGVWRITGEFEFPHYPGTSVCDAGLLVKAMNEYEKKWKFIVAVPT